MAVLIATIILICSLITLAFFLLRKIPVLAQLTLDEEICRNGFFSRTREKIKGVVSVDSKNFLQKILLRVQALSMRTERRTSVLLRKLSQKEKEFSEGDDYWEELKKSSVKKPKKINKNIS